MLNLLVALQKNNYSACNHSSNVVVRDFAQTMLHHFPPNSIVLTKGDLPTNSLRWVFKLFVGLNDLCIGVQLLSGWWSAAALRLGRRRSLVVRNGGETSTRRMKPAVWLLGSADTVCLWPPPTQIFDSLTLQLVCKSHLRCGTFLPNLGMLGLCVLVLFAMYAMDRWTDWRKQHLLPPSLRSGHKNTEYHSHIKATFAVSLVLTVLCSNFICTSSYSGWPRAWKPGNVREFDTHQGNVKDFTKNQGNVREIILSGKTGLKLFIVSCIFASIQVFSRSVFCVKY